MRTVLFDMTNGNMDELLHQERITVIEGLMGPVDARYDLRQDSLKHCTGCWSCWVRTPGKCIHTDRIEESYSDYLNSDKVIFMIGTKMGYINDAMKKYLDRLIPHVLPYILIEDGECHHERRYSHYPEVYFYIEEGDATEDELQLIEDHLYRTMYHFDHKSNRIFMDERGIKPLEHRNPKGEFGVCKKEFVPKSIAIYNGSPRGSKSNSKVMCDKIIEGIGDQIQVHVKQLNKTIDHQHWANEFDNYDLNLFVMPLYVHGMPSIVTRFIQKIKAFNSPDMRVGFIVQSGFPESYQSHYLRPYFHHLTKRLGVKYMGNVIIGGMEGLRLQPDSFNKKIFRELKLIGKTISDLGVFDQEQKDRLGKPARLSKKKQVAYSMARKIGLSNIYWNSQLKNNKAKDLVYDCPYEKK